MSPEKIKLNKELTTPETEKILMRNPHFDIEPKESWEILINDDMIQMLIPNFPPRKCNCQKYSIIKYSWNKQKFFHGCRLFEYGNPHAVSCGMFSWVPNSIFIIVPSMFRAYIKLRGESIFIGYFPRSFKEPKKEEIREGRGNY